MQQPLLKLEKLVLEVLVKSNPLLHADPVYVYVTYADVC
jgi:hypothetical protein